jgi:hypothetical protein
MPNDRRRKDALGHAEPLAKLNDATRICQHERNRYLIATQPKPAVRYLAKIKSGCFL